VAACAFTFALLMVPLSAQAPRLGDIVARLDGYLQAYELANVVAEETYRQSVEQGPKDRRWTTHRVLHSDYALTLAADRNVWVGYRDTFEVDGEPVRDRDERLQRLLRSGAVGQAKRIAEENARFNLGEDLISRTVNVPTFAFELLHPRIRHRFRQRLAATEAIDGGPGWLVEFRERDRPTVVRRPDGRDQPSTIVARVDPQTGEVLRTVLTWEHVRGSITVDYGRAPGIPVPVPTSMSERFITRDGEIVTGEATYANFRQFETSARIVR
jgi:hypothetical protein